MSVQINRDRDGAVPHLFLHLDGALALLEQQTGEGVTQIMESDLSRNTIVRTSQRSPASGWAQSRLERGRQALLRPAFDLFDRLDRLHNCEFGPRPSPP